MRQVQESLDKIQLNTSRDLQASEMKQQASAIELQQQLNELLSGIVHNLDKKGSEKSLPPQDLFQQLKQSVKDL